MISLGLPLVALLALGPGAKAPGDTWESLGALEPGPSRGKRIAALLRAEEGELGLPAQRLAFAAANRAVDAFELPLALELQEALDARVGAAWSTFNLALTLQKAGQPQRADELFVRMLEEASPDERGSIWGQRGIVALGAGRSVFGRACLGRALAMGDADAAAVLAREALARHNLGSAQSGFRVALARNQTHPWALRGWGLSMLPVPGP